MYYEKIAWIHLRLQKVECHEKLVYVKLLEHSEKETIKSNKINDFFLYHYMFLHTISFVFHRFHYDVKYSS